MINSYDEAIQWINNRLTFGIKPGLERMNYMLEKLNYPQRRLKTVHVAGTNGKGSTVSFMRSVLQEAGYKVGTFTSPYIETFLERISVNGKPINEDAFLQAIKIVMPIVDEMERNELGQPTEFEVLTVLAIVYFAKVDCVDIVLFETGLGGLYDSTNVIYPLVSVITTIGYDHMNILGNSLSEIAAQKAGIIKFGVPVITGVWQDDALNVIFEKANEVRAKTFILGKDFKVEHIHATEKGELISYTSPYIQLSNAEISMKGSHQVMNAAVALMTIDYLKQFYSFIVEEKHIRSGLTKTFWPGRFEEIQQKPQVIVDGAHNPEGINSLIETIKHRFPENRVRIIFSALRDKEYSEMVNQLNDIASRITFTGFPFDRAASASELFKASNFANKRLYENYNDAINNELNQMGDDEALVITGSLYFISVVRQWFLQNKKMDDI